MPSPSPVHVIYAIMDDNRCLPGVQRDKERVSTMQSLCVLKELQQPPSTPAKRYGSWPSVEGQDPGRVQSGNWGKAGEVQNHRLELADVPRLGQVDCAWGGPGERRDFAKDPVVAE